jgi:hypothetical protein
VLKYVEGVHAGKFSPGRPAHAGGLSLQCAYSRSRRHQAMVLQAAILAVLRKRSGGAVVGDGPRGQWQMNEAAN